jgi:hypothetical protein
VFILLSLALVKYIIQYTGDQKKKRRKERREGVEAWTILY